MIADLERTIRDRPWLAALLLCLAVALLRVFAALLVPMSYNQDEAMWIVAANSLWREGIPRTPLGRLPPLYPFLLAPIFGPLEFARAYDLSKILNCVLSAATIFPIWWVGRRFVSEKIALAIAVTTVLAVAGTFASVVMAESLFFFLFWLALAAFAAALEKPDLGNVLRLALSIVLVLAKIGRAHV